MRKILSELLCTLKQTQQKIVSEHSSLDNWESEHLKQSEEY